MDCGLIFAQLNTSYCSRLLWNNLSLFAKNSKVGQAPKYKTQIKCPMDDVNDHQSQPEVIIYIINLLGSVLLVFHQWSDKGMYNAIRKC